MKAYFDPKNINTSNLGEIKHSIHWSEYQGQKNSVNHHVKTGESSKKIKQIVQIVPHSGGLESKDFVIILLKSLEKYLNKKNYSYLIKENTEFGVVLEVVAPIKFLDFAKGLVKLVRVSPFGKGDKVHTSLCKLNVSIVLEKKEVKILDSDLKWDFYKSTGPGGQHKNKTLTAARLTHMPTGTVVTSGNERSQLENKKKALIQLENALNSKEFKEVLLEKKGDWQNNITPKEANLSIYLNNQLISCKNTTQETKKVKEFMSGNWELVK